MAEWNDIELAVARVGFWQLRLDPDLGLDGSSWLLEGVRGDDYWCVDPWSPQPDSENAEFRRLCLFLVALSGLEVTSVY